MLCKNMNTYTYVLYIYKLHIHMYCISMNTYIGILCIHTHILTHLHETNARSLSQNNYVGIYRMTAALMHSKSSPGHLNQG